MDLLSFQMHSTRTTLLILRSFALWDVREASPIPALWMHSKFLAPCGSEKRSGMWCETRCRTRRNRVSFEHAQPIPRRQRRHFVLLPVPTTA